MNESDRTVPQSSLFEYAPEDVLAFLRWGPDSQIVNHFGEHVWLGQRWASHVSTREKFGFITDCCFVVAPCAYHAHEEGSV